MRPRELRVFVTQALSQKLRNLVGQPVEGSAVHHLPGRYGDNRIVQRDERAATTRVAVPTFGVRMVELAIVFQTKMSFWPAEISFAIASVGHFSLAWGNIDAIIEHRPFQPVASPPIRQA